MNTNAAKNLPLWARQALGHAGAPLAGDTDPEGRPYPRAGWCPEGFAERVAARWLEIEHDVLPPLAVLSDIGKGYFFRVMFGEGMRVAGDTPRAARAAVRQLDDTRRAIADKAVELAELLGQQAAIYENGLAECDVPGLWELLEEAAADHPVWAEVASTPMERFLIVACGQSRPGPGLDDVLWALARRLRGWPGDSPLQAQATEPAFRTRQASQADYVKLLLDAIDRFPRRRTDGLPRNDIAGGDDACLPADFALQDAALATLVEILFGLPEGKPGEEAVKKHRLDWLKRAAAQLAATPSPPAPDALADTPRPSRLAPPPAAPVPCGWGFS